MKHLSVGIFLLATLLLVSCKSRETRESKFGNGTLKEQYEVIKTDNGSFIKDGFYKTWSHNGTLTESGNYNEGKKDGKWQRWYNNGKIQSEISYDKDSLDGEFKTWYDNEQMQFSMNYKNGKLHGKYSIWYDNGNIKEEGEMDMGKEVGLRKMFYQDKQPQFEITYNKGEDAGKLMVLQQWTNQGDLIVNTKFDNKQISTDLVGKWKLSGGNLIAFADDNTYSTLNDAGSVLGKGTYVLAWDDENHLLTLIFDEKEKYKVLKFDKDNFSMLRKYTVTVRVGGWFPYDKKVNKTKTLEGTKVQ